MNKYQEALKRFYQGLPKEYKSLGVCECDYSLLKDIVEKETPKKVIKDEHSRYCPNCKSMMVYDYEYESEFVRCSDCGQLLDWKAK